MQQQQQQPQPLCQLQPQPQPGVMHQLKEPQPGVMHQLKEPQLGVMHQLKEQLEERTRVLQADIKTQQQELHDIKEKLQLANLQVTPWAPPGETLAGSTGSLMT